MRRKMWGGNRQWMGWLPLPASGMQKTLQGFSASIDYENGGHDIVRSYASHAMYELSFPIGSGAEVDGIARFNQMATGFYGPGPFYFIDPMAKTSNLFAPNWASPGIIANGDWKNLYPSTPTYAPTPANSYNMPYLTPTWNINAAAVGAVGGVPVGPGYGMWSHVIPIPPDENLWIGATGTATGAGAVLYRTYKNGVFAGGGAVAMNPVTSAVRMSTWISGASADYVEVYLGRTASVESSVSLTALQAQVAPVVWDGVQVYPSNALFPSNGLFPVVTTLLPPTGAIGSHVAGEGNTGLEFADNAIVETYVQTGKRYKSMSTKLNEVGSWR